MPSTCVVLECRSNYKLKDKKGNKKFPVTFHCFPSDKELAQTWLELCNRKDKLNTKKSLVCSEHFTPSDYERDLRNELLGLPIRKRLKKDAVPSIFPNREGNKPKVIKSLKTKALRKDWEKEKKLIIEELLKSPKKGQSHGGASSSSNSNPHNVTIKSGPEVPTFVWEEEERLEEERKVHEAIYGNLTRDDLLRIINTQWGILLWKNKKIALMKFRIQKLETQLQQRSKEMKQNIGNPPSPSICSEAGMGEERETPTDSNSSDLNPSDEQHILEIEQSLVGFCTYNQSLLERLEGMENYTLEETMEVEPEEVDRKSSSSPIPIIVKIKQEPEPEKPPEKAKKSEEKAKTKPRPIWKCENCEKIFTSRLKRSQHKHVMHVKKKRGKFRGECVKEKPLEPLVKPNWRCELCKEPFETIEEKLVHRREKHCRRKWKCQHCDEEFRTRMERRLHVKESHADSVLKKWKCENCEEAFPSLKRKFEHKKEKHPMKKGLIQVCPHCSKAVQGVNQYTIHLRRHTGERPFVCETCGYAAIAKNQLDAHSRSVHADEGPGASAVCLYCGKSFKNSRSLKAHERAYHIDVAKSTCPQCHKVVGCVKRHIAEVHNNVRKFPCHVCDKKYKKRSGLNYHLVNHHKLPKLNLSRYCSKRTGQPKLEEPDANEKGKTAVPSASKTKAAVGGEIPEKQQGDYVAGEQLITFEKIKTDLADPLAVDDDTICKTVVVVKRSSPRKRKKI